MVSALRFSSVALLAAIVVLSTLAPAQAQRLSFIRDTETEQTLRLMTDPILEVAGIAPESVNVFVVNDSSLNAFVAGGQNIFVHTGLIVEARNASELVGVLAHEAGHIAGGHLARGQEALRRAQTTAIVSTLLGVVAAGLAGNADAAIAAQSGGNQIAQRTFLAHTRANEAQADHAALAYLDRLGWSAYGLMTFLETLQGFEIAPVSSQTQYVRTHPLTPTRIDTVRAHLERNPPGEGPLLPPELEERFLMMQAKVTGFLSPRKALGDFRQRDDLPARYGRAIARWRSNNTPGAIADFQDLLASHPNNPFFHEMLAQIYFQDGRLDAARPHYQFAADHLPDEPLVLISLARTKLATDSQEDAVSALDDLHRAEQLQDPSPFLFRLLATAYGRVGDLAFSALYLAEEALARGDRQRAIGQARRALSVLDEGDFGWVRAQDILRSAEAS